VDVVVVLLAAQPVLDVDAHVEPVEVLLDVEDGEGKSNTWVFETAAPNGLRRAGFSQKGVFKVGESYTFVGYQARDGSRMAFLESLTGPDGKTVKIWFGDPNAN